MSLRIVCLSLVLSLLGACATAPKHDESANAFVSVSCASTTQMRTQNYRLIDCQFKNRTSKAIDLGVKSVSFNPEPSSVKILSAGETAAYIQAYSAMEKREKSSEKTLLIGLLGSTALAIVGKGGSGTSAGQLGIVGSVVAAKSQKQRGDSSIDQPEGNEGFSEHHIYGKPFNLSAETEQKRSIFVEVLQPKRLPQYIKICFSNSDAGCVSAELGKNIRGTQYWD